MRSLLSPALPLFWRALCLYAVSAIALSLLAMPLAMAQQADSAIVVVSTRGQVEAWREPLGQATNRRALASGATLSPGDLVVTARASSAQLRFRDGATLSLGANTQFRVDAYAFDATEQRGFFALLKGSLKQVSGLLGKRDPGDYRLTTPTASIGIRGTEFIVIHQPCHDDCTSGVQDALQVGVREGRVVVDNAFGQVDVEPGNTAHVAAAGQAPRLGPGVPQFDAASLGWLPLPSLPPRAPDAGDASRAPGMTTRASRMAAAYASASALASAPVRARRPRQRQSAHSASSRVASAHRARTRTAVAPKSAVMVPNARPASSSSLDSIRVPLDQRPPMPGWISLPPLPEPFVQPWLLDTSLPHNSSAVHVIEAGEVATHVRAN